MSPRKIKQPQPDPNLLPKSETEIKPYKPLVDFFLEEVEDTDEFFEAWTDFYTKRPNEGAIQLIEVLPVISGTKISLTKKEIKDFNTESVMKRIEENLQESTDNNSPINLYFQKKDSRAFDFWTLLANSLVVSKGLYLEAFDTFKQWLFAFCESLIRPLRSASCIAVLSLIEFLAERIQSSTEEIAKLTATKKRSSVMNHQLETFQEECENSRHLSMELFTTVLRTRIKDISPDLRFACVKSLGKAAELCPQFFGDDNRLKFLRTSLSDESSRIRREALKQCKRLLDLYTNEMKESSKQKTNSRSKSKEKQETESEVSKLKPFFKNIGKDVAKMTKEIDNSISGLALNLLAAMSEIKLVKPNAVQDVFSLVADDSKEVRSAAAKLLVKVIFEGSLAKEVAKRGRVAADQELAAAQLEEIGKRSKKFSPAEISNATSALYPLLPSLTNWDLYCIILKTENIDDPGNDQDDSDQIDESDDEENEDDENNEEEEEELKDPTLVAALAQVMQNAAKLATQDQSRKKKESKELISNFSLSMTKNLKALLEMYSDRPVILEALIECSQYINPSIIKDEGGIRQLSGVISDLGEIFNSTDVKRIEFLIANTCYQWSNNKDSSINEVAHDLLEKLVDDQKGDDFRSLSKLEALSEFFDISQHEIRSQIEIQASTGDDELAAPALRTLERIFRWDVIRIRKNKEKASTPPPKRSPKKTSKRSGKRSPKKQQEEEEEKEEDYSETFQNLIDIFRTRLTAEESSESVREAAFLGISSMLILRKPAGVLSISPMVAEDFYLSFHKIEDKQAVFEAAYRPILYRRASPSLAGHIFWYAQDPSLKILLQEMASKMKDENLLPIDGSEIVSLIRSEKYDEKELKRGMKLISNWVDAKTMIDAWLDQPNDQLIPIFAPFLMKLTEDEASALLRRSSGETEKLLIQRINGKKLKLNVINNAMKKLKQNKSSKKNEDNDDDEDDEDDNEEEEDIDDE